MKKHGKGPDYDTARTEAELREVMQVLEINYYGRYRKKILKQIFHNLNVRLLQWIRNKYKRFRYSIRAAKR